MGQPRKYSLTLPLYNNTGQTQVTTLSIQTPVKQDKLTGATLLEPPDSQVFFRGTVRLQR